MYATQVEVPRMSWPKRFAFIGCSKTKVKQTRFRLGPADMYTGQLFAKRVVYAESRDLPWSVLSAKYGLFWPDSTLPWYDQTFKDMCKLDRAAWAPGVVTQFLSYFDDDRVDPRKITVELHAGNDYCHPLQGHLELAGFKTQRFCEGLNIGQQLAWYVKNTPEKAI